MKGFTTDELIKLDAAAFYSETLEKNTHLTPAPNYIHPVFQRDRWLRGEDLGKNEAFVPIGRGLEGNFEAANDLVWEAILPGLALSSRCVSSV